MNFYVFFIWATLNSMKRHQRLSLSTFPPAARLVQLFRWSYASMTKSLGIVVVLYSCFEPILSVVLEVLCSFRSRSVRMLTDHCLVSHIPLCTDHSIGFEYAFCYFYKLCQRHVLYCIRLCGHLFFSRWAFIFTA